MSEDLHALAQDAGLMLEWEDAHGDMKVVGDDTLSRVLEALGLACGGTGAIAESRDWLREERARAARHFLTADVDASIPLPLAPGRARLTLEDGTTRDVTLTDGADGAVLAPIAVPGYHRLETQEGELSLALAPRQAFGVRDASGRSRIWAPAVQVPSLRSPSGAAFGHFGDVAACAAAFATRGADALAISPVHALFPADPSRYSPYAPSTRLFLNVLFADPAAIGEPPAAAKDAGDLIDWSTAIPERLAALRSLHARRAASLRDEIDAFARAGGEELMRHARFDALYAHFFAASGAHGWQAWPEAFHDPEAPACHEFAQAHAEEIDFYLFAQWLADRSLAQAQAAARQGGMALGLITDLAVGMDPGGSHAWSRPDEILAGLSVGAPPDLLGPEGQNWGLTTFSPLSLRRTGFEAFLATIRAALKHAGGVRIDHVLGLRRIWVVPDDATPAEGVYLKYPQEDLFRLLALESLRARAIVVGEDLGTVPAGFGDEMAERGLLGMRVLWFERLEDGGFRPASDWDPAAAAMTSTHDLATVAGWWTGRDIDWTWTIGRKSPFEDEPTDRAARAEDRVLLWQAAADAVEADPASEPPADPTLAVDAAVAQVGRSVCELAIIPVEDLFGLMEQPNMPATIDEHPNWRRRLPAPIEDLLADEAIAKRLARLDAARHQALDGAEPSQRGPVAPVAVPEVQDEP